MFRHITLLVTVVAICRAYPNADAVAKSTERPTITTSLGQIQGSVLHSRLGRIIHSFRGVRYAKAPVNELRFQPPVPIEKYEGIQNATEDAPLCPQPGVDPISEDCLFLNVYTTKLPVGAEKPKRPVIVFIHGGGFYSSGGASYWLGPQYLMDHEIVLVTFNYRLGTLGFLSTGEKDAPGNAGLKDQVQVLKWVKQNIEPFGGDPNQVTIMGQGAGAISVVLHLVSPMSTGLFNKAAALSGSATGQWPLPVEQLEIAKKQAKLVNCADDTPANIIKCLRSKPASELAQTLPKFAEFGLDPVLIWTPVLEKDFGQPRFLTGHPITLIQNGQFQKVPLFAGVTNLENAHRAFGIVNNETLLKALNEKWDEKAPIAFLYERKSDHSKMVSKALKSAYFQDKPIDKASLGKLGELYADSTVGFAVNRLVKLMAEKNNESTFYYKFAYEGRFSHFYTPDSNKTKPYGVVHHDDLLYLFHIQKLFPLFKDPSQKEVEMVEKLTLLFTNFAKHGKPVPISNDKMDNVKLEPFTTKSQKYLDIGNKLTMQEKLFEKRYSEWEKLFPLEKFTKLNQVIQG